MDLRTEMAFGTVSAAVSAGDGVQYRTTIEVPPSSAASQVMVPMAELVRRLFTYIITPSTTIVSGASAGAIALVVGTGGPSGIMGMFQGQPFFISGTGNFSAQPSSAAAYSTTSTQIRKVLVVLTMSALGVSASTGSSIGGTGTLAFVYGSAMNTSALACTSAAQQLSYFDNVPLPLPSANEVPVGWLAIPNSFAASAGIANSQMFCDYRAFQGYNLSALLQGRPQP